MTDIFLFNFKKLKPKYNKNQLNLLEDLKKKNPKLKD